MIRFYLGDALVESLTFADLMILDPTIVLGDASANRFAPLQAEQAPWNRIEIELGAESDGKVAVRVVRAYVRNTRRLGVIVYDQSASTSEAAQRAEAGFLFLDPAFSGEVPAEAPEDFAMAGIL